jgi:hypothetical protein
MYIRCPLLLTMTYIYYEDMRLTCNKSWSESVVRARLGALLCRILFKLRECPCCNVSEGQRREGLTSGDIRDALRGMPEFGMRSVSEIGPNVAGIGTLQPPGSFNTDLLVRPRR